MRMENIGNAVVLFVAFLTVFQYVDFYPMEPVSAATTGLALVPRNPNPNPNPNPTPNRNPNPNRSRTGAAQSLALTSNLNRAVHASPRGAWHPQPED